MRLCALALVSLMTLGTLAPATADDARLEQEVKELRTRLEALERALEASRRADETRKKAESDRAAAAPARDAKKARKPLLPPTQSAFQAQGYIESRFTNYANSRGDERAAGPDFQLSRLRARLNFAPQEKWLLSLEVNAGTRTDAAAPVDLREFYFQYLDHNRVVRVGQQRVPFGYQVGSESSRDRAALERARVYSILFPNERDIGVVYGWNNHIANPGNNPRQPRFTLGVLNGEGINRSDRNQDKSLAGNVVFPVGHHELGASFYVGSSTADAFGTHQANPEKRAVGVEHRFSSHRFHTQFEYLFGELFGGEFHGGLVQFLYSTGRTGNFFIRGDVFDPNTHRSADFWRRVSLGWYRDITPSFRLTTQYDFLRAEGTRFDNTWGIETQLRF